MSLATRCPACGTGFRVVQDQLKVSEGWVRCGRCERVFHAAEALFELEASAVAPTPAFTALPMAAGAENDAGAAVPLVQNVAEPAATDDGQVADDDRSAAAVDAAVEDPALASGESAAGHDVVSEPPPAWAVLPTPVEAENASVDEPAASASARRPDFVDARFNLELIAGLPGLRNPAAVSAEPATADVEEPRSDMPRFLLGAPVATRWQRPRWRWTLASLAALLGLALIGQAAHHGRDVLATRWPAMAPALQSWCGWAGCRVQALRRIDDIVVESTALTPPVAGSEALRLSVVLANRGEFALAPPAIDLSLTDSAGALLARRVLFTSDFHVGAEPLRPAATAHWQAMLQPADRRVAGYTVEVFYP